MTDHAGRSLGESSKDASNVELSDGAGDGRDAVGQGAAEGAAGSLALSYVAL